MDFISGQRKRRFRASVFQDGGRKWRGADDTLGAFLPAEMYRAKRNDCYPLLVWLGLVMLGRDLTAS